MANPRLISIIVPAMNEQENVNLFYDAVKPIIDSLNDFNWEIIFVDDGSTDATVECISEVRKKDPRVCVIQLSRNFGSYAAIKAGFDYARGDACITISADLQDPPELFRSFTACWQEGYHIVWGVREQRDDPWSKRVMANLFYRLIRRLALADLPEHGMDCGLFDRKIVDTFRQIRDKNSITFMTIYWMGFRQALENRLASKRTPYLLAHALLGFINLTVQVNLVGLCRSWLIAFAIVKLFRFIKMIAPL